MAHRPLPDSLPDLLTRPDRREFLVLSAMVGSSLAVGMALRSDDEARPRVMLSRARIRPGGELGVEVEALPADLDRVAVHVVRVDAQGKLLEVVDRVRAERVGDRARGQIVARRLAVRQESWLLAGVVVLNDGSWVCSSPVEVVCTLQLPGV